MQGKIIKGIAGFYYVYTTLGIAECKARGIFRKEKLKPLVGDDVVIELVDEDPLTGNIVEILPRRNALIRPASANIDQALVIFAMAKPVPNFNLLDRFLISMQCQQLPTLICFNKQDLSLPEERQAIMEAYRHCGCEILFVGDWGKQGILELKNALQGKTTVVAGPSGVGKSTLINTLCPEANMETGELSQKIERGRHTTRHAQLFALSEDTFLMDTPGFTSLDMPQMEKEELSGCYPEFEKYQDKCRFAGCAHISEPDCAVKEAIASSRISRLRYDNYILLYDELKNRSKQYYKSR